MELARTEIQHSRQPPASFAGIVVARDPIEAFLEKTLSLTLGFLITLALAFALQKGLPQQGHLPTFFYDLRARVTRALVRPVEAPTLRPAIETVAVHSTSSGTMLPANAESTMRPKMLLVRWRPFIAEASRRFKLPASWIQAVMQAESGGRTMLNGKPIISRAGALGLMQLLPETYNDMRARYRLGTEIADPHDNIIAGAAYLRALHRRYGFPLMFAAYNAGPGQFERDVLTRHSLPAETRAYVRNVVQSVARASAQDVPAPISGDDGTYAAAARLLGLPA